MSAHQSLSADRLQLAAPLSERLGHDIEPVPSLNLPGDVEASAAASNPQTDAAAALSVRDQTRMVDAIARVMEERHKQLDNGHTLDRDLGREHGERRLLSLAVKEANYAKEDSTLRVGGADWIDHALRHAAKSAALLLAFTELMLERKAQQELEPEPAPIEQGELKL